MSLTRWFRKNNKKIMVGVIFIAIVGFVIGPTLRQFTRARTGRNKAVAYINTDTKITLRDLNAAHTELQLLEHIGAKRILTNSRLRLFQASDFQSLFLAELLFQDRQMSPYLIEEIKRQVTTNKYRIGAKQVYDIYSGTAGPHLYWLMLKTEAEQAGIIITNDQAGKVLAEAIPKLFDGTTYSQLIGAIIKRQGIPEEKVLSTFAKLMAVIEYAKAMCSSENVTAAQIKHKISVNAETMNLEFVQFNAVDFVDPNTEPSEKQIAAQFDKYKGYFEGDVSDDNPYGFGYMDTDRLRLEYIVVKTDEIENIISTPTQQETEEFYLKNTHLFTQQIPDDPNDPNSPAQPKTQSYPQVADSIYQTLLRQRINTKAEMIMMEAKIITESTFDEIEVDRTVLSDAEFAQLTGDYKSAAAELSSKYNVSLHSGTTGLLNVSDIRADEDLGRLFLENAASMPIELAQIVFAVDELSASRLGPFDLSKPRMHENIGPMKDMFGQIVVLMRIVEAQKASVPESINLTFDNSSLKPGLSEEQGSTYSVKEKVGEDLKNLWAMDKAKDEADRFVIQIANDGWETAIDKINELYKQTGGLQPDDPNVFTLRSQQEVKRLSLADMEMLNAHQASYPAAQVLIRDNQIGANFLNRLYQLVPTDSNNLDAVPQVVEFKPAMSYYVIKNLSINRVYNDDYEKSKSLFLYSEDITESQSLAVVHFNPENILKRTNFRWIETDSQTKEPEKNEKAI